MTEGSLPFDGGYGTGPAPDIVPEDKGLAALTAKRGRWRFGLAHILLILAALFGGIAFAILPDTAPLQQPQPYSIQVGNQQHPENRGLISLGVQVDNPKQNVTELALFFSGALSDNVVSVTIYLPSEVAVTDCRGATYRQETKGESCKIDDQSPFEDTKATLTLPVIHGKSQSDSAVGAIDISTNNFGVDSDGVTAEVTIPSIFAPAGPDGLSVHYFIGDASSYDWSANSTQLESVLNDGAAWIVPPATSTFPAATSTYVSGISHEAQKRQNFYFFFSGALIAVAGGALIGAVQEFFHGRKSA